MTKKFEEAKILAEQGDACDQTTLGYMYYTGKGTDRDYEKAEYWWRKSAAQGDARAQLNLSNMYRQAKKGE